MTLYIDLSSLRASADRSLVERVPREVAAYYLALPIASEDGRVTVVTAYPENFAALGVLARLLGSTVVPISSSEAALQRAIAQTYPESPPAAQTILVWTDVPAWQESVIRTAQTVAGTLHQPFHVVDPRLSLDEVVAMAQRRAFSLVISRVADQSAAERLVRELPVSLLMIRGESTAMDNLLLALRGFGSDYKALERAMPLIEREAASTTLLPLARSASANLDELLVGDAPARHHLESFVRLMNQETSAVAVRLSQGDPTLQVIAELSQGQYNMLVIAAEADGDFVWQMLSRIEREQTWPGHPVLIVRPPLDTSSLNN